MELPNLNLRHLAALAATVRHGSVTAAASAVHLTQPALTQAIGRLEHSLDCALFVRQPTGMAPTEPALLLAARVDAALRLIGSSRVTTPQVRAFLALARAGSYADAAQASGHSSASLHRAVADLSVALGQRLAERRGRHISLTTAGQRRARAFSLAMTELRAGLDEVAAWQGRRAGRVAIGAMPLSRAEWLPAAILEFRQQWPGVRVTIVEGSYSELVNPLRDGEIDAMLGALRGEAPADLLQEPVFDDSPRIIARAGHPLLSGSATGGAELARSEWILPGPDTPLRHYWEEMLRASGVNPPPVTIECGSVLTIRQLLLGSDALTLLSPSQLAVELEAGLLGSVAPPTPVSRTIGVTTRVGWRPTAPQAALLERLRGFNGEDGSQ